MLLDAQFAKNLDMIESALVALAAYVAIRVALGWRKDFVGRRQIEVAEELLVKVYEARTVLREYLEFLQEAEKWSFFTEQPLSELEVDLLEGILRDVRDRASTRVNALKAFEPRMGVHFGARLSKSITEIDDSMLTVNLAGAMLQSNAEHIAKAFSAGAIGEEDAAKYKQSIRDFHAVLTLDDGTRRSNRSVVRLFRLVDQLEADVKRGIQDGPRLLRQNSK